MEKTLLELAIEECKIAREKFSKPRHELNLTAEDFRHARKAIGLTIDELAEVLGFSIDGIKEWETSGKYLNYHVPEYYDVILGLAIRFKSNLAKDYNK